jgi:hypothetical protein
MERVQNSVRGWRLLAACAHRLDFLSLRLCGSAKAESLEEEREPDRLRLRRPPAATDDAAGERLRDRLRRLPVAAEEAVTGLRLRLRLRLRLERRLDRLLCRAEESRDARFSRRASFFSLRRFSLRSLRARRLREDERLREREREFAREREPDRERRREAAGEADRDRERDFDRERDRERADFLRAPAAAAAVRFCFASAAT